MNNGELDLLLYAVGYCVHKTDAAELRMRVQANVDWRVLSELARNHGVGPLLYRALDSACPDLIPEAELHKLRHDFKATANRNLLLTGELFKLLRLLQSNNIRAIPFKGPVLSMLLFGDPTFREFGDLDILVPISDVVRARDLLLASGYATKYLTDQFEFYTHFGHELDLVRLDLNVAVDLQWRFASKWIAFPINLSDFWSHSENRSIGGQQITQPALDDMLLVLCGHGYRHFWVQLKWIADIAGFVNTFTDTIQWAETLDRATRLGGRRIMLLGLHLAHRLLGTLLPNEIKGAVASDRHIELLVDIVMDQIRAGSTKSGNWHHGMSFTRKLWFHLKVRERWQDKFPDPLSLAKCVVYWGQRYVRHCTRQLSAVAGVKS
jgi:Uncharacterised nucleotidyltransferase